MAAIKYRQYKNGIYGFRYRKYYIGYDRENNIFTVFDPLLSKIGNTPDRLEAQRMVLLSESHNYPTIDIEKLTKLSLHDLDSLELSLANKEDESGLRPEEDFMHAVIFNLAEIKAEKIKRCSR